jgi:hypothetical protein
MRANMESTNGYGELIGRRRVQPLCFSEQRYCRARVYCWHARLLRWPVSVAGAVISIEGVYESIQRPIRGR